MMLSSFLPLSITVFALHHLLLETTFAFVVPAGNSHPRRTTSPPLFGKRMKFQPPPKVVDPTEYIQILADGEDDVWKTMDVVDILQRGGIGVLPTDTGYSLVTPLSSKTGLERLFRIQNLQGYEAPVHLLCSNLATIDEHCFNIDKMAFKILKKNLPGSYTFVLPAKQNMFPKDVLEGSKQLKTVGVRIPDDPVVRYLQDELLDGMPLLASSLGGDDEDDEYYGNPETQTRQLVECMVEGASWCNEVDFIVDAGGRPQAGATTFDMTRRGDPTLVREGLGELELVL